MEIYKRYSQLWLYAEYVCELRSRNLRSSRSHGTSKYSTASSRGGLPLTCACTAILSTLDANIEKPTIRSLFVSSSLGSLIHPVKSQGSSKRILSHRNIHTTLSNVYALKMTES